MTTMYDELKQKQQAKKDGITFKEWMLQVKLCLPEPIGSRAAHLDTYDYLKDFNAGLKPIDSAYKAFTNAMNK